VEKTNTETTNERIRNPITLSLDDVQFDKDLYPRQHEDENTIERYREAIDHLPSITVARSLTRGGGWILVDGFHRWKAYQREGKKTIQAEDLGELTDEQILKEAISRNAGHGRQLDISDKRWNADRLYKRLSGSPDERCSVIAEVLSITVATAKKYCEEAKRSEKEILQDKAWEQWLDCLTEREISEQIKVPQQTISGWVTEKRNDSKFGQGPDCPQHLDIWTFTPKFDDGYFRKMEELVLEQVIWLYTKPGQIIFDPMVRTGTIIHVAKGMGRRIWGGDLKAHTPTLPIHEHDIASGCPSDAPPRADFVFLNPPRWQDAGGKSSADLGSKTFDEFIKSWRMIIQTCKNHLAQNNRLAFSVGPMESDDNVAEHTFQLWRVCADAGFVTEHRMIIPYEKDVSDVQIESAHKEGTLFNGYRELVIMCKAK
jgi:hypothetical protein